MRLSLTPYILDFLIVHACSLSFKTTVKNEKKTNNCAENRYEKRTGTYQRFPFWLIIILPERAGSDGRL